MGNGESSQLQKQTYDALDPQAAANLKARHFKLKLVKKMAKFGNGPVQKIAIQIVDDEERLQLIIEKLEKVPDVHNKKNRIYFAKMSELEYNSLRSRVEQLCLIQQQLDARIERGYELLQTSDGIEEQLLEQQASPEDIVSFGLQAIVEDLDQEEMAETELDTNAAQALVLTGVEAMNEKSSDKLDLSNASLEGQHILTVLVPMLASEVTEPSLVPI
jgi:hypothetical protein